jgi:uncharacterized protein
MESIEATRLEVRAFPGRGDPSYLHPTITPQNRPFYDGLARRELVVLRCAKCRNARFPAGPVCPHCHSAEAAWEGIAGTGTVRSWMRYHRSYVPELEDVLPYTIVVVELDDGPALFGRLATDGNDAFIGMRTRTIVERWADGTFVHAFVQEA